MDEKESISLRDFLEEKINSLSAQTQLRFDALDKALTLAREDMKEKYGHLNDLRTEVITDRGILVSKEICLKLHKDISTWMGLVDKKLTILETRSITWTAAVGVFFLIVAFVMRWYGK